MADRARILIVDDELGVRESLRAILGLDYEVLTAADGTQAIETVARESVDVVTLDLRMPGLGGISVLEQLKRIDPDVEVLIITGYGCFDTAIQGLRHRAFDYISKPFDIDHVRRLVATAVARRETVRRLRTAPEHILSTLSHEFRTPLNVIMGYSNMLRDEADGALSGEQLKVLDRIQANSTALLSYVETLFYIAELDRGSVPVLIAPVTLAPVFHRIGEEIAPRAAAKGLLFTVDVPTDLVVTNDGEKLGRLLGLLADNAVRYTETGEVSLIAQPGHSGDDVAIAVRDTGPGIAREVIIETEHLVAGGPNGTPPQHLGFGLRLAGRLVRTLGAGMTLTGGPGGTTFRLAIPSLRATDVPATTAA